MSKKFGKFLLFSAAAGAAAYGAYYYLQKKDQTPSSPADEETDDDFDDFSEDLDEEIPPVKERTYVPLNLDKAEAIAQEAFHKAKEVIVDSVQQVKDTVKSVKANQAVSESNFTDLTALNKERTASGASDETAENAASQETAAENEAGRQPAVQEEAEGQPSSQEQENVSGQTDEEKPAEPVNAEPAAESSEQEPQSAPAASEESKVKEIANGQVEDFFDDTP